MSKRIIIALSILGALLAAAAIAVGLTAMKRAPQPTSISSSPAPSAPGDARTQMSDGGGVQVQVTFDPKQAAGGAVVFQVSMNTHSVELSQFDLGKLAELTLDPGGVLAGATWQPEGNGGGHHVSGYLTVKDPQGLLARAKTVRLQLRDVAGEASRQFQWSVRP